MILGRGHLDYCGDADGHGIVGGYYQTLGDELLTGLDVRIGGLRARVLDITPGLPSPDSRRSRRARRCHGQRIAGSTCTSTVGSPTSRRTRSSN